MFQIKKINKYNKNIDLIAIIAVIIFLLLATFIPSVKTFFVLAFLLFGFLTIFYSFPKAMIYAAFPLGCVIVSQIHSILVIPAKAIASNQYWEGRHLFFGISPYTIISTIALLMIPFWQKKFKSKIKLLNYEKLIIILIGLGFLSSLYGSLITSLSLLNVFFQLVSIVWAWYLSRTLFNSSKETKQKILTSLFFIVSLIIFYESLIVIKQTISQSSVGLLVESTKFTPTFGLGADESGGGFRPFGLQAHPNGLANNQLKLAFCALLIFCHLTKNEQSKRNKKILIFVLTLSLINIILSLSRAAFIAIFLVISIFFVRHKNKFIKIVKI